MYIWAGMERSDALACEETVHCRAQRGGSPLPLPLLPSLHTVFLGTGKQGKQKQRHSGKLSLYQMVKCILETY